MSASSVSARRNRHVVCSSTQHDEHRSPQAWRSHHGCATGAAACCFCGMWGATASVSGRQGSTSGDAQGQGAAFNEQWKWGLARDMRRVRTWMGKKSLNSGGSSSSE